MKQNTIKKEISFSGIGLHSGVNVNIKILPAPINTGIIFKRTDIKDSNNKVKATYNNVVNTNLGTTIGTSNNFQKFISNFLIKFGIVKEYGTIVRTIEHFMASLWACNIDNAIIEIDNKEIPIMDGSADLFIKEIQKAGLQQQEADRKILVIKKNIKISNGDRYIELLPHNSFKIDLTIDFNYGGIGKQFYSFNGTQEDFIKEISQARTFCNIKDVEFMKKHNLARGGSEENAMVFDNNKILNKDGFRCDLEPVKHKLLDCVGDMFTSGYFIKGYIKASKTGHTMNNLILKKLFSDKENFEII